MIIFNETSISNISYNAGETNYDTEISLVITSNAPDLTYVNFTICGYLLQSQSRLYYS